VPTSINDTDPCVVGDAEGVCCSGVCVDGAECCVELDPNGCPSDEPICIEPGTCVECTVDADCDAFDNDCQDFTCDTQSGTCVPTSINDTDPCVVGDAEGVCCSGVCVDGAECCFGAVPDGCDDGQICRNDGVCVCNGTSCPNGCCTALVNGNCITPQSDTQCGIGGVICTNCNTLDTECKNFSCTTQLGTCTPVDEPPLTPCGTAGVCCDGDCFDPGDCCIDDTCPLNETCQGHLCECGSLNISCGEGFTCCSGECVDLDTNPDHCGACDDPCALNETCSGGVCDCPTVECLSEGVLICCEFGSTCALDDTCPCVVDEDCPELQFCCEPTSGQGTCRECCEPDNCASEICVNNECEDCIPPMAVCSTGVCAVQPDKDCCCFEATHGAVCSNAGPQPVRQCIINCGDSDDCPAGTICDDSFCKETCTVDADCSTGLECISGVCEAIFCEDDGDCPTGRECDGGACVFPTP
jgi:hypothetical protein